MFTARPVAGLSTTEAVASLPQPQPEFQADSPSAPAALAEERRQLQRFEVRCSTPVGRARCNKLLVILLVPVARIRLVAKTAPLERGETLEVFCGHCRARTAVTLAREERRTA